jgi:hypothetical protein
MYNYSNLNDVEFEELCKDVMEKMLNRGLRIFAKGRDGGIDLTDNANKNNIIIQVKHYVGSTFANLRTTLKKEVEKVHKLKPNQYYLCVGMQLSQGNIKEIYDMFSAFMETDKNIITLKEIDGFLNKDENTNIVRKHYKLWLHASNILSEINNQNIFIDCEALLSDVNEECKYFVQTRVYNQCLDYLENNGLLMITGGPGVGKTITSKMLVLFYASQGFRVRYTTNGDIADIKKSLSGDKDCKEIVLLDDCLGQHYFNMKHTQENELLSLITHIKFSTNKKLILNSRITIFNEAKERSIDFNRYIRDKKIKNYTINMDDISLLEKAKIFYNHLIYKGIPKEYYEAIKLNKNYLAIVQHMNYTPRIIEHVTLPVNYRQIDASQYFKYVIENLSNPNDIWKNEFNRRLQSVDRAYLSTLYSLSDTSVDYDLVRTCFNKRLSMMKNVDHTVDNFDLVTIRLNQSIINVIDNKGKNQIGVINPSVNDYLKNVFANNEVELNEVRNSIYCFAQVLRTYSKFEQPELFKMYLETEKINSIYFSNVNEKYYFIAAHICEYKIKNDNYKEDIRGYLQQSYCGGFLDREWLSHTTVLERLLDEDMYTYYSISEFVEDRDSVYDLLLSLSLDELIQTINILGQCYKTRKIENEWFMQLSIELLRDGIVDFTENVDVSDYCDKYNIGELLYENRMEDEDDIGFDTDAVVASLEDKVNEDIEKEIVEKLRVINADLNIVLDISYLCSVSTRQIENVIESYFREVDYDDDRYDRGSSSVNLSEIEVIFDR